MSNQARSLLSQKTMCLALKNSKTTRFKLFLDLETMPFWIEPD
jgi:hypothetical protein